METTKEVRRIKDVAPKPSDAIQAMIDGLKRQSRRKLFRIEMSDYGDVEEVNGKVICYGCAATCALQQLGDHNFKPGEIYSHLKRAHAIGFDAVEVDRFEWSINGLRLGDYLDLFGFYSGFEEIAPDEELPILYSSNWRDGIPAYQAYADKLRALGL